MKRTFVLLPATGESVRSCRALKIFAKPQKCGKMTQISAFARN